MFDETYYAKDAWSLLHFGVEQNYIKAAKDGDPDPANVKILAGNLHGLWTGDPSYVVHPPGGKWMIAIGEQLFGFTPFGWRFMVALAGTLAVLMTARIGRRLFRSTLLGCVAGLLLAVDGMAFVHSRTALLDPLLMFWALAAFGALLVDRDRARARLADRLDQVAGSAFGPVARPAAVAAAGRRLPRRGLRDEVERPVLRRGVRPDDGAVGHGRPAYGGSAPPVGRCPGPRRRARLRLAGARRVRGLPRVLDRLVPRRRRRLPALLGARQPRAAAGARTRCGASGTTTTRRGTSTPTCESYHPYRSNPWGWLVLARPVSYFYEGPTHGRRTAAPSTPARRRSPHSVRRPIWWAACLALPVLVFLWAARRDWRAGAILAGVAAGYLPWFLFQHRTIYSFYAVAFLPFLVLAITMCIGMVLGGRDASPRRRQWGAAAAGAYLLLAVANFAWLLPVLSAEVIPYADWAAPDVVEVLDLTSVGQARALALRASNSCCEIAPEVSSS